MKEKPTFDTFLVGIFNQFAYAVAKLISDDPDTAYYPVFIYSSVGSGKTYLMHAIALEIASKLHGKAVY